ncbi:MAG: PstC family ABC transporter permease, partial [Bacilli bacterium]
MKTSTKELIISFFLKTMALIAILISILIIFILLKESYKFFQEVSLFEFLFTTKFNPSNEGGSFGVIPLLVGTLMIVFFAIIIALPLGLGAAIYMSEYASFKTRKIIKPILELLAGIPSVVYGFFALRFITPI